MTCKNCGAALTPIRNGWRCDYCGDITPFINSDIGETLYAWDEPIIIPTSRLSDKTYPVGTLATLWRLDLLPKKGE